MPKHKLETNRLLEEFNKLLKKDNITKDKYLNIINKISKTKYDWFSDVLHKIIMSKRQGISKIKINTKLIIFDPSSKIFYDSFIEEKYEVLPKYIKNRIYNCLSGEWIFYYQSWISDKPNILICSHLKYKDRIDLEYKKINKIKVSNGIIGIFDFKKIFNNNDVNDEWLEDNILSALYNKNKNHIKLKEGYIISTFDENNIYQLFGGYYNNRLVKLMIQFIK